MEWLTQSYLSATRTQEYILYSCKTAVACPTALPQEQNDPAQESTNIETFPTFLDLPAVEVMKERRQRTGAAPRRNPREEKQEVYSVCVSPRLLFKSFFNCCQVVLGFGSLVLRLYFPSSGLFTQCYSNDFVELSSLVLYLTSVLSKSSLSTAEKFGAGFAEFLSC